MINGKREIGKPMNKTAIETCDFCLEVVAAGSKYFGTVQGVSDPTFSRLIRRTSVIDVYAGLGALSPGYTIVIPRKHVLSSGELDDDEFTSLWATVWLMGERITAAFGDEAVVVEHGSSGLSVRMRGSCIDHAHVHIVPVTDAASFVGKLSLPPPAEIVTLDALRRAARDRRDYYYVTAEPMKGYFWLDPELRSQHVRRVWATELDRPTEWDWAAYPNIDLIRKTATTLRDISEPSSSNVAQTVAAYDESAKWYAEQTAEFPDDSSLPSEIAFLAEQTDQLVLDAGCGAGRDAREFTRLGSKVVALDASRELLLIASKTSECIAGCVGDVRAMPFPDGSFGVVWCSAVLLHLSRKDSINAFREIHRVLDWGGFAQVSVKLGSGHLSEPIAGTTRARHFFYYGERDLEVFAGLANLTVERIWSEFEDGRGAEGQTWLKILVRKLS